MTTAKDIEDKTLRLQGDKSERLIEIYCLYSFFEFQKNNFDEGMRLQRKSTIISKQAFGAESPQYI